MRTLVKGVAWRSPKRNQQGMLTNSAIRVTHRFTISLENPNPVRHHQNAATLVTYAHVIIAATRTYFGRLDVA